MNLSTGRTGGFQRSWQYTGAFMTSFPASIGRETMADDFDPYREALVMETDTEWPEEYADLSASERASLSLRLHEKPAEAAHLEYVRTHTGFCRKIVVTPEDVARVST